MWAVVKAPVLGWIAAVTAGLTAFYMFRLLIVVFLSVPRSEEAKKAQESPLVMVVPLLLLAIPAVIGGWPFIEHIFFHTTEPENVPSIVHYALLAMFLGGAGLAWVLYRRAAKDPVSIPLFANRLYIDNLYTWIVKVFQDGVAWLAGWSDRWIVDLFVAQVPSKLTWACGYVLRFLQLGNIQAYAFFFGAGVVGLIYLLIAR